MNRKAILSMLSALAIVIGTFAFAISGNPRSGATSSLPAEANVVRFAAFGDMGTGDEDQKDVARSMLNYQSQYPFDTVLMLGDNIYPDGNPKDLLDKFERPYAELIRRGVNFYASLGNHDVRRGRDAQTHYPLFHMDGRSYYAFTKGQKDENLVEFYALDSTRFDEEQHRWLEGALANSKAHWKVAFFHHPIYSSGRTHGSDMRLRGQLEPLFVKYGVAAVFAGHDHIYERIKPQQGVQYFVCGIGGKLRSGNLDKRSPLTAFGNDEVNGFMAVEITPEHLSFQAVDAAGHVFDSGEIPPRTKARAVSAN